MLKTKYDFSGYATKIGLKCSDGRTILKDAFKDQDGQTVPLVWQHLHNEPANVLGHAILENREDGVYCYGKFNDTEAGKNAKELVSHGDICSLSIYANQLQEKLKQVIHGAIREVSLVLSGANPGALIDNLSFSHTDGTWTEDESEAIIYTGLNFTNEDDNIAHKENQTIAEIFDTFNEDQKSVVKTMISYAIGNTKEDSSLEHKEDKLVDNTIQHVKDDATIKEVFDTLNEDQKNVVYYLIGAALEEAAVEPGTATHSNIQKEGETIMKSNVFDQSTKEVSKKILSPDQIATILGDAKRCGSLKESFIAHAEEYGFDPIGDLFPDAKDVEAGGPITIKRQDAWVDDVLSSTNHTPFSRIRTRFADLTAEEARAKGYVTGEIKKEEVIVLLKRSTTPTTIYKKQKLDRDDIVDITDFDVIVWLKKEMRGMLDEEIARAVLIGDGRIISDEDKINEQNVRPIAMDDDSIYIQRVEVEFEDTTDEIIDEFIRARKYYKGSGVPALYTSTDLLTEMLLVKDKMDHRMYKTVEELASVLRVSKIVEVEPMNEAVRIVDGEEHQILGIVVNLKDYTIGADKGGQVAMFDDFDIDYNQYKYLIETRCSGALTKPKSALVIERLPEAEPET
jgi:HK97 family phage prohead protease